MIECRVAALWACGLSTFLCPADAVRADGCPECEDAVVVEMGDTPFAGTATGCVVSIPEYGATSVNTGFFQFTPSTSGPYRISTCFDAWDDDVAVLSVWTECGPGIAIACGVAGCPGGGTAGSRISLVELEAGVTYRIGIGVSEFFKGDGVIQSGTLRIEANDPAGTACANATEIFDGLNAFDTTDASERIDLAGFCDSFTYWNHIENADVFTYTPESTGIYTISTCGLVSFDSRLAIMQGCSPISGVLACADKGSELCGSFSDEARIDAVELIGGVQYYVVVGGFLGGDAGPGQIEIGPFVPCALASATTVEAERCGEDSNGACNSPGSGFPSQSIALGDTIQGTFWADGDVRDTDWYSLTIVEGTEVSLTLRASISSFAAVARTSCPLFYPFIGPPTQGQCPETTSVCLAPGQYYIVVLPSGFSGSPCGAATGNDYTIEVTGVPCDASLPSNDLCANATVATEGANPFDNTFASTDVAEPTCGDGFEQGVPFLLDVWFSFTPTVSGNYTFDTCSGVDSSYIFDTGLELYDGCPGDGMLLACSDNGECAPLSRLTFSLSEGATYLVRVAGWGGSSGQADLTITRGSSGEAPPNDDCARAVAIFEGATAFNTDGATGATPACGVKGSGSIANDIWFQYKPESDGAVTVSLCDANFNSKLAIFEGDCNGPLVACNDDFCGLASKLTFVPQCGRVYLISVGAASGTDVGSGSIVITSTGQPCGGGGNCPADLDLDGVVGSGDLGILLASWGDENGSRADLDRDGIVGSSDLGIILAAWGACE